MEWLKRRRYGQYAVQIVGNILFHSVPYTAKSKDSLEYWEYDKLGTDASLGCIRLAVKDVKWIYDYVPAGTYVEFYDDTNPGPLGKPTAPKISDNELCRNWDPTDYVEGNPWNNNSVGTATIDTTTEVTVEPTNTPSGNDSTPSTNTEVSTNIDSGNQVVATPEPTTTPINEDIKEEIVPLDSIIPKSTPRPTSKRTYINSTPTPTPTPVEIIEETTPVVDVPDASNNEVETSVNETNEETNTSDAQPTNTEPGFILTEGPVWAIE